MFILHCKTKTRLKTVYSIQIVCTECTMCYSGCMSKISQQIIIILNISIYPEAISDASEFCAQSSYKGILPQLKSILRHGGHSCTCTRIAAKYTKERLVVSFMTFHGGNYKPFFCVFCGYSKTLVIFSLAFLSVCQQDN